MRVLSVCVALAAATALAWIGFAKGTYAAGGSDSSCYALMADAFASGQLRPTSALASGAPWPDASKSFAPGGFVSSPSSPGAASPVCAPGFSLLLAPLEKIGGPNGIFWFTPLAGALLVWLTFVAGRTLGDPVAGAMAAVLVAASPAVLYQVVQPMNDVTTAALWMAVFVSLTSRRWFVGGICCGLALLVRPNLLPLAVVAGVYSLARPKGALRFAVGAAPFVGIVLWLNASLYGGALRSGYGQVGNLFRLSVFPTNAARYLGWLVETHTAFPLLGIAAPFVVTRERRGEAWLGVAMALATAVIYFAYTPFDDWSYLRFLLPAIGVLIVLASLVTVAVVTRVFAGRRAGVILSVALITAGIAAFCVRAADSRLAFTLHALEQRYRSAAIVVRDRLPTNAVVLTTWDSGAIRFHARKEAIVWDALDPDWLDRAITWLSQQNRPPFILVESWEEPRFRERFHGRSVSGDLDWPPRFEADRMVRIYDPADRARFLRGERVITEYLWPFTTKAR